jgi:predicted transposase/invertase (TIGR01784 family)
VDTAFDEGKQEGRQEGKLEGKIEVAIKLKLRGVSSKDISEITGLHEGEIDKL